MAELQEGALREGPLDAWRWAEPWSEDVLELASEVSEDFAAEWSPADMGSAAYEGNGAGHTWKPEGPEQAQWEVLLAASVLPPEASEAATSEVSSADLAEGWSKADLEVLNRQEWLEVVGGTCVDSPPCEKRLSATTPVP